MIQPTQIEFKYIEFINGTISVKEFEDWVYSYESLEDELSYEEYITLISFNYNKLNSRYELEKVLKESIDESKIEAYKILSLLDSIITRDGNEGDSLVKIYDYYCRGYEFLDNLALNVGLEVKLSGEYGYVYYSDLEDSQKDDLLNKFYPLSKNIALELKGLLLNGDILLTGKKDREYNRWQFIDKRRTN